MFCYGFFLPFLTDTFIEIMREIPEKFPAEQNLPLKNFLGTSTLEG